MRIKLALLCEDSNYAERLTAGFNNNYNEKLEVYLFSNRDNILDELVKNRIDIFLCDAYFDISQDEIPKRCGFAYLVDEMDITSVREMAAICKYQKLEQLYKAILGIYSENVSEEFGFKTDANATKMLLFTSAAGGVGTSTSAVACAKYLAALGRKTLFLSLDVFGSTAIYFSGEGNADFSDILYMLKSRKANFALKLESTVCKDASGVYFIQPTENALDMNEMTDDEMMHLVRTIQATGSYEYLIVDIHFGLSERLLSLLKAAYKVVMVSNGTASANLKCRKAIEALQVMDSQRDEMYSDKIYILYDAFSSKSGKVMEEHNSRMIGGMPKYENAEAGYIADQISKLPYFSKLM